MVLFVTPVVVAKTLECENIEAINCAYYPVVHFQNSSGGFNNAMLSQVGYSSYEQVSCCKISGYSYAILNTCEDGIFLKLSNTTNAHAQLPIIDTYSSDLCMSLGGSSKITCTNRTGSCLASETCIIALNQSTNSHVAACGNYSTQICCTASIGQEYYEGSGGGGGIGRGSIIRIEIDIPAIIERDSKVEALFTFYDLQNATVSPKNVPVPVIYPFNPFLLLALNENGPGKWEAKYYVPESAQIGNYSINITIPEVSGSQDFEVVEYIITSASIIEKIENVLINIKGKLDENIDKLSYRKRLTVSFIMIIISVMAIIMAVTIEAIKKTKKEGKGNDFF